MALDRLTYDQLLTRLDDAEDVVRALMASETDAVVSANGVHVLRLHDADRALQAAKTGLEQMLAERTQELTNSNEKLRREIANRERLEEELRRSAERLQQLAAIVEFADEAIIGSTLDGTITSWNHGAEQLYGFRAAEMTGKPISRIIPKDRSDELPNILRRLAQGERIDHFETARLCKEGNLVDVDVKISPIRNSAGEVVGASSIAHDITARKHAEEALRQSQERLGRLYESSLMGVFNWNADGSITHANDRFLEIIGYSRQELSNGQLQWSTITPPEYHASDKEALQRLKASGVDAPYEKEYVRKDGSRIPVLIGSATIGDERNAGISIVLDIGERKRAERALIRTEKLASVGRMAATVAHEINNPLEVILNSVYIASLDKSLSKQARESLIVAEQELNRVAQLTRQTLGFYRENTAPSDVDLVKIVNEVLELYWPKVSQRSMAIETVHKTSLRVRAVAGELRQVVLNILANAIDASPRGGTIRIRTNCVTLGSQSWVRLTFADEGEGIPRENLSHIFEPFFTTKETFGTGLGLWVTSDIVKRHNGKLRLRSRPGLGTVFSIMLPATSNSNRCKEETRVALADTGS